MSRADLLQLPVNRPMLLPGVEWSCGVDTKGSPLEWVTQDKATGLRPVVVVFPSMGDMGVGGGNDALHGWLGNPLPAAP